MFLKHADKQESLSFATFNASKKSAQKLGTLLTNDRLNLTSYPGEATVFVGLVFTDVDTFPIRPRSDMDMILGIKSDDVDESDSKSPLNRVRSSFSPVLSGM